VIEWQFYPLCDQIPEHLGRVVSVFEGVVGDIDSETHSLKSNEVLAELRGGLNDEGYLVESGKGRGQRILVPVLFGRNGAWTKRFDADAYSKELATVIEVEAGRAITNHQFLKDLFQACMMFGVDYAVIAVRRVYRRSKDFEAAATFFDTLYTSGRMTLPLKGVLLVGY